MNDKTNSPRESGKRIATFPRSGRPGKPTEEQRWTVDTFEGHPYIGGRIWTQGSDGCFYPTQKGITVRRGELLQLIRALCGAAREMGVDLHPKAEGDGGR
jgi:hypothetical protein